jgi:prevent-host-death family protein
MKMYNILYTQSMEKKMTRSMDITSFTEHRQHLREHLQQVRETGRPLFITTNGETNAVVLSPEAYDALADKAELAESLAMIDRSTEDIRAGRTQLAKPALKRIADELGLKLDR